MDSADLSSHLLIIYKIICSHYYCLQSLFTMIVFIIAERSKVEQGLVIMM